MLAEFKMLKESMFFFVEVDRQIMDGVNNRNRDIVKAVKGGT